MLKISKMRLQGKEEGINMLDPYLTLCSLSSLLQLDLPTNHMITVPPFTCSSFHTVAGTISTT